MRRQRITVLFLVVALLGLSSLSFGQPVPEKRDRGIANSNPLGFLQAQPSSYVLVGDASADFGLLEAGGSNQLMLVNGLPGSPTIAQMLPMADLGVVGGVAISPDGDTALALFWAVPDQFVTGFAVVRGLSTGAMQRDSFMLFAPVPAGEQPLVAVDVAFAGDGQTAVILRQRVDDVEARPFNPADPGTHSTLNVITGLPDAPVIGPDVDIPAVFAGSFALTRDGDRAAVISSTPKGLTLVEGLAPGGEEPHVTFIDLVPELGPTPYFFGEAPVGGVALTLDEDGVILPIQNNAFANAQGRIQVYTGLQSGEFRLARTLSISDGVGPWLLDIAVHPSGDRAIMTEQFNAALNVLSGTLNSDPHQWQASALAIADPFSQSVHDVVFLPDGDTAVVASTDLRSLGLPQYLGSLTIVTGFNSGNLPASPPPPVLVNQVHPAIIPDSNIAAPPPALANYVSLFTRGKPGVRHLLDSTLRQAIEQAGQKKFDLARQLLKDFAEEVARQQAQGHLTNAQAHVLTTLVNLGTRRLRH